VTFQTDQIQAMIAEIDAVLNQSSSFGLGWLNSRATAQQRRVLELVRSNLLSLEQQIARAAAFEPKPKPSSQEASNQQLQQARSEIAALRQQRQALMQEIAQLEQQRQNYLSQPQQSTQKQQAIAQFFQALMGNLQETLTPQIVQTLSHLETELVTDQSPHSPSPDVEVTDVTWHPQWQEQAAQLRKQQARLDRLLKSLDAKLNLMFETLQVNMQKYQSSFSQGLEKMHSLSAESEAMLTDLIAGIEQELEQAARASQEYTSSAISADAQATATATAETTTASPSAPGLSEPTPSRFKQYHPDDILLPYAGFEWRPSEQQPQSDVNRKDTEKESRERESRPEALYGGMAALVAQTESASTQPPARSSGSIGEAEKVDTISTLTDLIENSALGQSSPPQEEVLLINPVEAQPLGDETDKEELEDSSPLDTDVSTLKQPQSPELDESVEELPTSIKQIEADLNPEPIATTLGESVEAESAIPQTQMPAANAGDQVVGASAATALEEEVAGAIPDDILAEFDELFGGSNQDPRPAVSDIKAELAQPEVDNLKPPEPEPEKKAATKELRKAAATEIDSFSNSFDAVPLTPPRFWYLGIDFGTTGLSAALLNGKTRQVYPITWSMAGQMDESEPLFRLPAEVYLQQENSESATFLMTPERESRILLKNFKQYLKIGLPYYSSETGNWEPAIQQSNHAVPLHWVGKALQALLSTLKPNAEKPENVESQVSISAVGLASENLNQALLELAGAIASVPAEWPEAYRFNVREAILGANLVENPEQICFVEEGIASALAQLVQANVSWQGDTLIIHAGASTTELGLVEIPENITSLSYSDFACRSFPYAGNFIDQDIICQLLLKDEASRIAERLIAPENSSLELPLPGEPDLATRYRLQQILESSPVGQILLEAAKHVKLNLQHQDSSTLEIDRYRWVLQRQALENLVYSPFIQCLNRELNVLLVRQGVAVESIRQVICTGGTARIDAMREWVRQKLPNATLIQDTNQNASVALGLVTLPLYPQVLDAPRHQYGDYFLLLELLRSLREQPLSVGKITQLLERRGINTGACQQRILAYLEGYLPPGIVPSYADALMLTEASRQNAANASAPLFHKQDNQTYCLNAETGDRLRRYFNAVLEPTRQTFEEPLGVYWLTPTVNR
jgi:hypothetical protein